MSNVLTRVQIAASPERVWQVITDFDAYAGWNPVITRIRSEARIGAAVRFRIRIEGTPEVALAARVVQCEPGRLFAWRGGAPLVPAIAWGEHYFRIEPASGGTSLLTHGEDFGGVLAAVVSGRTHARVVRTYDALNAALKSRAESLPA